jgi:naphthoate synthase
MNGAQEILGITYGYQNAKFAMNLTDDGMVGQQVLVKLPDWPMTEEATEGRNAFLEKRKLSGTTAT